MVQFPTEEQIFLSAANPGWL